MMQTTVISRLDDPPLMADPLKRWAVVVGIWTLIALFFISQSLVRRITFELPLLWAETTGLELIYWYAWAVLTPIVLWLARRYRIRPDHRWEDIARHCAMAVVLGAAHGVITYLANIAVFGQPTVRNEPFTLQRFLALQLPVETFTGFYKYWLIVIIWWALDYHRKYREQEVQAAQLETKLTQAQLQALKMQLHPHFLFNTLHAVSMLNFTDVDAANRMLVQLSDLLRLTLENSGAQEIRLRQELDFLRRYLEIEQTRFQDRLSVEIDADARLLDAQVPNLILQPLVENAIRHGLGKQARAGRLRIVARRDANDLILEVADDGPGLPEGWRLERDSGIGLSNTVARLRQLYGARHRFELVTPVSGGLLVRITLPLSFSPRPQEST